jgi:hypothetical protein
MRARTILLALGISLPLLAGSPDQRFEVVTTDRADLAPGGTVRIQNSTGELNIEGWDQPQVEITVVRYRWGPATPKGKELATQKLNSIQVTKKSNGELTISTSSRRSIANNLDYQIMVPRNAKLIVRHRIGDVVIHDVGGDLDVSTKTGDIVLQLSGNAQYKIDARAKLGGVYSDMADVESKAHRPRSAALNNSETLPQPPRGACPSCASSSEGKTINVFLRSGIGGIDIQRLDAVQASVK